jgi:urea transport system ATP-binding protein
MKLSDQGRWGAAVIHAIRDAENRARFLGYRVESYKLWVFVVSAVIAGVAGALYVPQIGIINPSEFAPINSIEAVIWVAVGGRGTLVGAAAGAVMVNYAKTYFTAALPEVWLYALGAMFVLVTLFLPRGLAGLLPAAVRHRSSGAGKTTMMDVITGKTRPDCGTAWFGRRIDLLSLTEPEIVHAGIGRKFQKPSVFEFLTVFENLELALKGDKSFWNALVARLSAAQRQRIDKILESTGLTALRDAQATTLSHGQKQWLEIGMLLMQGPELLVSLAGDHSVVVVEHDMDFVRSIARRVIVLHERRVLSQGDMDKVQQDPHVIEVYLGK